MPLNFKVLKLPRATKKIKRLINDFSRPLLSKKFTNYYRIDLIFSEKIVKISFGEIKIS